MITLKNEYLTLTIRELGAELVSVIDNKTGYEFLWQGSKRSWSGQAPVLFPIVGALKNNQYTYQGKTYELPQHGFARRTTFNTQAVTDTSATFYLKSNEDTLAVYPFEFSFQITYILFGNKISVSYEVLNPSHDEPLYYSVGGHPGFNVSHFRPEKGQPEFQNVSYTFEPQGAYLNIPLLGKHVDLERARYVIVDDIPIMHKTFRKDAQIYRIPRGTSVVLNDNDNQVKITLSPNGMDLVGIWSSYPKKDSFVCLEPWAGIADTIDASGELTEKYAINCLEPGGLISHDYTLTFEKQ
ncbi:aldose 1-epimerase family protein [Tuanshanicoccus lijuaniae]|uniref:aldose 1-epimerase family protein n=1 Tax=Aerococcaceae bacterium zg-1292 TaxID=2774330 RepID=UPI00193673A4|nr:aldose 1-epimerase family protein [Aerococcaceae bacterium zg-1292]MBF6625709.1 aldose 1-epimerase family protein [Aerococcaceae bacterium zg-BR9]MBF6977895.1 aldose 1-epimerase family protein [Aerococcaceae bacterium zg-BR22]MBS4455899.1 aldose 1-epimerase family protein [Aerococcaceae bacterium zg-A91]MBS4457563.1 aldose 1-epimerase family protein [Aerococcaceae bacterium zg-BR33]